MATGGHHQRPRPPSSVIGRATELRMLDPPVARQLGQILDNLDGWQTLMENIPRTQADAVSFADPHEFKYSFSDICKIKEARLDTQSPYASQNATQILFDEWGTSGRVRPTLGHLLQLLVQLDLYRAADFLAVDILKEEPPSRPATGIAARVDISLPSAASTQLAQSSASASPPEKKSPANNNPTINNGNVDIPLIRISSTASGAVVGSAPAPATRDGPNMDRTASKAGPSNAQKVNDHYSDFIVFSQIQQQRRLDDDVGDEVDSSGELPALSEFNQSASVSAAVASRLMAVAPASIPVAAKAAGGDQQSNVSSSVVPLLSMLQHASASDAGQSNGNDVASLPAPPVNHSAQIQQILAQSGLLLDQRSATAASSSASFEMPALSALAPESRLSESTPVEAPLASIPEHIIARSASGSDFVPAFSVLQRSGTASTQAEEASSTQLPDLSGLNLQQSSGSSTTDSM